MIHTTSFSQADSIVQKINAAQTDTARLDILLEVGWQIQPTAPEEAIKYAALAEPIAIKLRDPLRANQV